MKYKLTKNAHKTAALWKSLKIVNWEPVRTLNLAPNQTLLVEFLTTIMERMDGMENGLN